MSTPDFLHSPHAYTTHTPAPTIESNASVLSQTFGYDVKAVVRDHVGSAHLYGKPPSLKREDAGHFPFFVEKDALERRPVVPRGTLEGPESNEHISGPNISNIMFWIFCILLVLGVLWIPGILAWSKFPNAKMLGVDMLRWSIWSTIFWAGLWTTVALSYLTPSIFKSARLHRLQPIDDVRAAHRYLGILFWTIVVCISYQPLIVRNMVNDTPAKDVAIIDLMDNFLLGNIFCALFFAVEKCSIQRISERFHERSYAKRIQDLEATVQSLCLLYKNTVDVVVRSDAQASEMIFGSTGRRKRKFCGGHLKGMGHGHNTLEMGGYSTLQEQAPEPFVRVALSSPRKSRLLAKRIFYSFSRPGANYVRAEDVSAFFLTPEDASSAFALFDRDGNGDASRDEIEAMCLEFHQEQVAIKDSIRDMNAALGQLDGIMMAFVYVSCAVIFAVVLNTQLALLIAGVGALILALCWLAGGSLQEVMTSIIFLFAKHPFDVGDGVIIQDKSYTVKEIKLLSTVFLDSNLTITQVSNHHLNNLFIYNSRRSSHSSEKFMFDVHFSTTFQEIEKIREKMLEFLKSENRDFQPTFDLTVKDFSGQSRIILSADIEYKSNIAGLKVKRRNKWLCALKSTLAELHIYDSAPDVRMSHGMDSVDMGCNSQSPCVNGEPNSPSTIQQYAKVPTEVDDDQAKGIAVAC